MCGRYAITVSFQRLRELLAGRSAVDAPLVGVVPSFNIAPTQQVPVLTDAGLGFMRWGIPAPWEVKKGKEPAKARPLINAQAEKLERWPWKSAFLKRRAVLPATDWYEWIVRDGERLPVRHHAPDGGLLYLAGLWSEEPGLGPCVTVLTVDANAKAARVHDRMPALLSEDEVERWLAAPDPALARTVGDDRFVQSPASRRVNSYRNNDPELLTPDWAWTDD